MIYEKLPIKEYRALHEAYEARGLAIPDGALVELTDWAKQNGVTANKTKKNPDGIYRKVGNASKQGKIRLHRVGRIKVQHGDNVQAAYYWAGFWQPKGTLIDNPF